MIKQKAPKDMTATEFVEHLELVASREMLAKNTEGWAITLQGIRRELSEPAPNPFTPDQLAWMRVEQQNGYHYAYKKKDGSVFCGEELPEKTNGQLCCYAEVHSVSSKGFLACVLEVGEFICFADYAPLEEK